jgi:Phage tail lysozyme
MADLGNQKFVVDILTKYRDEGIKQAQEAQIKLKEILGASTAALGKSAQAARGYGAGLERLTKLSWLGVAAGETVSKMFTGIAAYAERAAVKVALFGEELYYMNRRLGQPGTGGLFNFAFAAQQIGLSPEQGLGAIEGMGAAVRTNPGLSGLLSKFLPGYKPGSAIGSNETLGFINQMKGRFGEKGYFAASQFAGEFGLDEYTFRQMWTNIEELNEQTKIASERQKQFGLDTDKSSKSFTEFHRALNPVIDILEVQVTRISAWLADKIGTPILKGAAALMSNTSASDVMSLGRFADAGAVGAWLAEKWQGTTGGAGPVAGNTAPTNLSSNVKEAAIQRFMGMGLSREAAIGAATGLQGESGQNIDPQSINKSSGAYGIANWLGQRKRNFAAMFGHPIEQSTAEEQWQFLSAELNGKGGDPQTAAAFKLLKNPNITAGQATGVWENMVERHGQAAYTAKLQLEAQNYSNSHPSGGAVQNFDVDHTTHITVNGNADMGVMKDAASILGKDRWDDQLRQAVRGSNFR